MVLGFRQMPGTREAGSIVFAYFSFDVQCTLICYICSDDKTKNLGFEIL
jgi:hypothetical protein